MYLYYNYEYFFKSSDYKKKSTKKKNPLQFYLFEIVKLWRGVFLFVFSFMHFFYYLALVMPLYTDLKIDLYQM